MVYGGWTVIMGYMGGASIFLLESCQLWCNSTRAFYFPCNPVLPSRIDYLWHALAQANHYFGFHALLSSCGRCPLAVLSPFSTDASPQELWPNCLAVINLPLPFLFPSLSSAVHTSLASITNLFFHISCRLSLWSLCWWCMVPGIFFYSQFSHSVALYVRCSSTALFHEPMEKTDRPNVSFTSRR